MLSTGPQTSTGPGTRIVLHQYEVSPFCDKVRRILRIKGIAYEVHEITPSRSFFEVPRLNPIGKLPTLDIDGERIADSTEIAHYLERRYPEPPLLPADPRDHAQCHLLEDWADESLYFYEMTMRFAWPHNAKRWSREAVRYDNRAFTLLAPFMVPRLLGKRARVQGVARKPPELVISEVERHVAALEALLGERDWLVADALSLADIAVAVQLGAIRGAGEGAAAIAACPPVERWLERTDAATTGPTVSDRSEVTA